MLVRMLTHIGGYRDFAEWPEIGGTLEVSKIEGDRLIAGQLAEEVTDEGPKAKRDTKSEPESDSGTVADGDEPTVAVSDADAGSGTEGDTGDDNDGVVNGEATIPTGTTARRAPAKRTGKRPAKRARRK